MRKSLWPAACLVCGVGLVACGAESRSREQSDASALTSDESGGSTGHTKSSAAYDAATADGPHDPMDVRGSGKMIGDADAALGAPGKRGSQLDPMQGPGMGPGMDIDGGVPGMPAMPGMPLGHGMMPPPPPAAGGMARPPAPAAGDMAPPPPGAGGMAPPPPPPPPVAGAIAPPPLLPDGGEPVAPPAGP